MIISMIHNNLSLYYNTIWHVNCVREIHVQIKYTSLQTYEPYAQCFNVSSVFALENVSNAWEITFLYKI